MVQVLVRLIVFNEAKTLEKVESLIGVQCCHWKYMNSAASSAQFAEPGALRLAQRRFTLSKTAPEGDIQVSRWRPPSEKVLWLNTRSLKLQKDCNNVEYKSGWTLDLFIEAERNQVGRKQQNLYVLNSTTASSEGARLHPGEKNAAS